MNIYVIGWSGQIARVAIQHLVEAGHSIGGIDKAHGFDAIELASQGRLAHIFEGVDVVVHLAVSPTRDFASHVELPTRVEDIAITCAVVQACIDAKVPRLIFGSSVGIDPSIQDVWNYYAASKRIGEILTRAYAETEGRVGVSLRLGAFGNPHLGPPPESHKISERGIGAWMDWALSQQSGYHAQLALGDGPEPRAAQAA